MKKILSLLSLVSVLSIPALSEAAGLHVPGYVYASATTLYGSYNVRYNAAFPGSAYIYANSSAGSSVSFAGTDGSGNSFYCYVPNTSPIYAAAVDIKNGLGNGSYVYVTRGTTSSVCTYVYSLKSSYFLS